MVPGALGFFVATAIGVCAFAAMAVSIMLGLKTAAATSLVCLVTSRDWATTRTLAQTKILDVSWEIAG
jgi:hypothetical protein